MSKQLIKVEEILNHSLDTGLSIAKAAEDLGYRDRYISGVRSNLKNSGNEKDLQNLNHLMNQYNIAKDEAASIYELDEEFTDSGGRFDDRSRIKNIRDEDNKIVKYTYEISLRDRPTLNGELTRNDMEYIYGHYPHHSANWVSMRFPTLDTNQFKKVLRAFNITKTEEIPPHILEESNDEEIQKFILNSRKARILKSTDRNEAAFLKQEIKDLQKKIGKLKSERDVFEELRNRVADIEPVRFNLVDSATLPMNDPMMPVSLKEDGSLYVFFGDTHIGKRYRGLGKIRGYDIEVAHDRFQQILNNIIAMGQTAREINIYFMGDMVETILEDGMHPGQTNHVDIRGGDQVIKSFGLFHSFLTTLSSQIPGKIRFRGIGGNHDRIERSRDADFHRTASYIVFGILKDMLKDTNIDYVIPVDGIIDDPRPEDNLRVVAHHGDRQLSKRNTAELLQTLDTWSEHTGLYNVVAKGHLHKMEANEGNNYMNITVPPVCSGDQYSAKSLGYLTVPGYVVGWSPSNGIGFEFMRRNLH